MISEGSCDTKDWSNGCWKFSYAITVINYFLIYIKIKIIILKYIDFTVFLTDRQIDQNDV